MQITPNELPPSFLPILLRNLQISDTQCKLSLILDWWVNSINTLDSHFWTTCSKDKHKRWAGRILGFLAFTYVNIGEPDTIRESKTRAMCDPRRQRNINILHIGCHYKKYREKKNEKCQSKEQCRDRLLFWEQDVSKEEPVMTRHFIWRERRQKAMDEYQPSFIPGFIPLH